MDIDIELILEIKEYFELNRKEIITSFKEGSRVVEIDFSELSAHSPEIAEYIINFPKESREIFELALEELEWIPNNFRIMLKNIPDIHRIKLDNLRAKNIGQLVFFEGVVLKRGKVKTRIDNYSYECPSCGTVIRPGNDFNNKAAEIVKCSCGRRGGFKEIERRYMDFREVYVQDEDSKEGMDVRFEDVFIEGDYDKLLEEGNILTITGIMQEKLRKNDDEIEYTLKPLGVVLKEKRNNNLGTIDTLLKQLGKRKQGGFEFEEIVALLFKKKGYVTKVTKKTGDMGTDIIAKNKEEKIAIQCKLNESGVPLSNSVVQKAMGACRSPYDANKLIIVTSSNKISPKAKEQSQKYGIPVEIWDRERFMAEYNHYVRDLEGAWDILNKEDEVELEEIKSFDTNKITETRRKEMAGMKVFMKKVCELEDSYGKGIPIELLIKNLEEEMSLKEIEEFMRRLLRNGDLFRPKRGFIMRI